MRVSRWWWGALGVIPLALAQGSGYFASGPKLSAADAERDANLQALDAGAARLEQFFTLDASVDADPPTDPATGGDDGPGSNGLAPAALGLNALTTNPMALQILIKYPLRSETFENSDPPLTDYPNMGYQLHDENAQKVMKYLVSCALGPGDSVSYKDTFLTPPETTSFRGDLGLCKQWGRGAPTRECLQLVSACILARVNGLNRKVAVSLRGEPAMLLPLRDRVKVRREYRENGGTPINSFRPCTSGDPHVGKRNCGWTARYVGQCGPGLKITVGAGAGRSGCSEKIGSGGKDMMLRVCRSIYGCDDTHAPGYSDPFGYNGFMGAGLDTCAKDRTPAVTFSCPSSGYYGVMVAPRTATSAEADDALAEGVVVQASDGAYPATEAQVFTYREGGFYGDLFEPGALHASREIQRSGRPLDKVETHGPIYDDMYACYSELWSDGTAYMNDRICAGAGSTCFLHSPRLCDWAGGGGQCKAELGATGPSATYKECLDIKTPSRWWTLPIAVYLNDPCDLEDPAKQCLNVPSHLIGAGRGADASPRRQAPSRQPPTTPR